ncbi:hypothetical protein BT67DRAFT_495781 [Trichocladium antarcticum]|uniref:Cerato-platanin n=1 Tax=Trichocladium antarcticum TaxID=1450529 RepID=A0AAN6ZF39_9PEZI|nr:hypothetical protein BT67DRAFT_495781 [Trichocladium antarcticum]
MVSLSVFLLAAAATLAAAETRGITPHEQYSSSVGVLGCKIDTNRVAYWPGSVDCDNICVRVSYGGRSVDLLRIDQSGGASDISYDAYNFLVTGRSARDGPITGGAVSMEVQDVPADNCAKLIRSAGLPLSASNSMNYVAACLAQPNSWVARHHQLFNIQDPLCHWGYDEVCTLDLAISNQPSCPHQLGTTNGRLPDTVYNIEYGTGARIAAP